MLSEPIHKAFMACSSVSPPLSPCNPGRRLWLVRCSRDEEMVLFPLKAAQLVGKLQSIFITRKFHPCEFAYTLKFICIHPVNPCDSLMIICGHAQARGKYELPNILIPNSGPSRGHCFSSLALNKCPLHGLFSATFSAFL